MLSGIANTDQDAGLARLPLRLEFLPEHKVPVFHERKNPTTSRSLRDNRARPDRRNPSSPAYRPVWRPVTIVIRLQRNLLLNSIALDRLEQNRHCPARQTSHRLLQPNQPAMQLVTRM